MVKAAATGVAFLMLSVLVFAAAVADADSPKTVMLRWAFVAITGENGGEQVSPIVRDTALKTGDRFKILVEPEDGTFIYLIYRSSQNELHLLYPQRPGAYDEPRAPGGSFTLPPGGQWFQLDANPGEEIFSLIASDRRLTDLEALLVRYEAAAAGPEKNETADRIDDEIRRLRWEHRGFKSTAERPATVMGQLRGVQKPPKIDPAALDIADYAVDIESQGFYSRTFTIDHRR
ncbi:MAG: DUF4384 domain-containing protein [Desulfobacterales bacterium]|jgi:hypothetical protein